MRGAQQTLLGFHLLRSAPSDPKGFSGHGPAYNKLQAFSSPQPMTPVRNLHQVMRPLGLRGTHVPKSCQKHTRAADNHTLMCWVSLRSRDRGLLGMGQILGRSRVSPSLVARRLVG